MFIFKLCSNTHLWCICRFWELHHLRDINSVPMWQSCHVPPLGMRPLKSMRMMQPGCHNLDLPGMFGVHLFGRGTSFKGTTACRKNAANKLSPRPIRTAFLGQEWRDFRFNLLCRGFTSYLSSLSVCVCCGGRFCLGSQKWLQRLLIRVSKKPQSSTYTGEVIDILRYRNILYW